MTQKTVLLCILDGFGIAPETDTNPIVVARTPMIDMLKREYAHSALRTDGEYVGVVPGQMGNSEVGHITIGSGRIIKQSLPRISADLEDGDFANMIGFKKFLADCSDDGAIHLIGLLSDGGIHSHMDHVLEIAKLLNERGQAVYIHAITDGRDTAVDAAMTQIPAFEQKIKDLKNVSIVSVVGRFYGMDRDERWDRSKEAWDLFTQSTGTRFASVKDALQQGYDDDLSDEHITASKIITDADRPTHIIDGDAVFLFNFRSDRMRQTASAFLSRVDDPNIQNVPKLSSLATITDYDSGFRGALTVVYEPKHHDNLLGEVVANAGLNQLRIAETEKYAHVTFFFNNGRDEPYKNEDRILVPSPRDVDTYDEKPEMSLPEVTTKLVDHIHARKSDLIVLNIANGDMVGHTGNFPAAVKAVEHIDNALSKILGALTTIDGEAIIIADHGNIEEMLIEETPSTQHSTNPVPCIYFGDKDATIKDGGLADVAPTLLDLLDIEKPAQMTGSSLLK